MSVLYQNHMRKAVASSVFMVIRIRDIRIVLPEYLSWFLNHPQTQAWCKSEARGSSLLSLTQESLENLELSILPIAKQIKILETTALMKKEKALQQHIHSLRENRNQHLLLQAINSASQI